MITMLNPAHPQTVEATIRSAGSTTRRRSRLLWLAVALLLLTSLLSLISVRSVEAAEQVPFSATLTTAPGFTVVPCGPLTFCLSPFGEGTATHLGRTTFTRSIVSTNTLVPCPDVSGGTIRQFTDTLTLTAANGDSLTMSGTGTSCANGIDVVSSGSYMVTGGTGRFSDASGTLTLAIARFAPEPEITTLTGTISSVGSVT